MYLLTALNRRVGGFLRSNWYDGWLRWEAAHSDYFGLHPCNTPRNRFLRGLLTSSRNVSSLVDPKSINCALKHEEEVTNALDALYRLQLPPHNDRPKNWDALKALAFIQLHGTGDSTILDMGSGACSWILRWLQGYGYRHLYACDLATHDGFPNGNIRYAVQDLERAGYEGGQFDFVTCLSVIEHGVDPARYFSEAHRILKPGAYLITSTDYWCEPVQTRGLTAYGHPVQLYSPLEVRSLLRLARQRGFTPVEDVDLGCREPVVHWQRMDLSFTFLFFVLRRDGA